MGAGRDYGSGGGLCAYFRGGGVGGRVGGRDDHGARGGDVALLCFGRWAFGDVDNEDNWILLGSKVETIVHSY